MITSFWWGNLKETAYLEDLSVDGRVLKRILRKEDDA